MDNFELFLEQVKIYQEIEKHRKRRFYALLCGAFFVILFTLYYFLN